jgi:hypothetical protein
MGIDKSYTRTCIWCLKLKNISDFDKYEKSSDGYRSQCKSCIGKKKRNLIKKMGGEE